MTISRFKDSNIGLLPGKILQVVRATDSTARSTTSTSYVDVTGMSVSITPRKSDSLIIVIANFQSRADCTVDDVSMFVRLVDGSNNTLTGSTNDNIGSNNITGTGTRSFYVRTTLMANHLPNTTSSVTYKVQFAVGGANQTARLQNHVSDGLIYAIEVSA